MPLMECSCCGEPFHTDPSRPDIYCNALCQMRSDPIDNSWLWIPLARQKPAGTEVATKDTPDKAPDKAADKDPQTRPQIDPQTAGHTDP